MAGRVRGELGRRVGGAGGGLPLVILPQGWQRLQGPGPPQAVASAMRSTLEAGGADPETAPPERGDQVVHVPAAGRSSMRGRWAFQLRTGWVVVRVKVRWASSSEIDGDGVLGDVDGHDGMGVAATQSQFLAGDQNDSGGRWPTLHGDWLHRGSRWRASGAGTA